MSHRNLLATLGAMLLALGGCASTAPYQSNAVALVDSERVAQVEHAADRAGVKIRWINPPTVRVK